MWLWITGLTGGLVAIGLVLWAIALVAAATEEWDASEIWVIAPKWWTAYRARLLRIWLILLWCIGLLLFLVVAADLVAAGWRP